MKRSMLFILTIALCVASCRKEQPALSNGLEDCGCAREVSADFSINEIAANGIPQWFLSTETDTSLADQDVQFSARTENAEYTWLIGSETIHEKEVFRYFSFEETAGITVPITLIVKKNPNKICFPNDDGIDTLTKMLSISKNPYKTGMDLNIPTFIEGKYRLKEQFGTDSIDVSIDYFYEHSQFDGSGVRVINLRNNNDTIIVDEFTRTFREIRMLEKLIGNFHVSLNGLTTFNFEDQTGNEYKKFNFKGRKL